MKVVIIGGGAAGVTAATRLRRLDENAEIVILERTNDLSVSNCGLLYYLSGDIKHRDNLINTTAEKLKSQYNINTKLNAEVELINRREKSVSIKGGGKEYYDRLIFTIGAYQLRPDIDGVLGEQIFTIRDLASIDRIKNYIKDMTPTNAVIVGGGYIGIEAAEALHKLNINVSIIEASDRVLSSSFDTEMSAGIQNLLRSKGIKLYLNTTAEAFEDNDVLLSNGRRLPYDMAIIATGVKPDLRLSVLSELEIGETGGLIVNDYMQTSDKNIYAAGDDIELRNLITQKPSRMSQAGLAIKEARIIAEHISGVPHKFKYALNTSIAQIFDYTAAASGATECDLRSTGIDYKVVHLYAWAHAGYIPENHLNLYKLLFDKQGTLLGVQAWGKQGIDKRTDILATAIISGIKAEELEDLALCYAPPYGSAGDAVNTLGAMASNVLSGRVKFVPPFSIEWNNLTQGTMLIDVRSHKDFEQSHLEHAINIPQDAIRHNLSSIPQDKPVILYDDRGIRSYVAASILHNHGFKNIYVLSGGKHLYDELLKNLSDENETLAHL